MSVIDTVGKLIGGVVEAGEDVAGLAKKVWDSFKRLWSQLTAVAQFLTDAWDWMVKGAEYIGVGLEHLAKETAGVLWNVVTHDIPTITAWLYHHTVEWAWNEIEKLSRAVAKYVDDVIKWAQRELGRLERLLLGWVRKILHWAAGAVHWVTHFGDTVWRLISHPGQLATLLADHIVWPVLAWFLKEGAKVIVYLLKQAMARGSEVEHLAEDIIHDLL